MNYANVVPVRRMPPDRPWLTYRFDDGQPVQPGSLVTIPLRGRSILGVVWNLPTVPSTTVHLETITTVHLQHPILTDWQMKICFSMAETGATSLGEVLWRVIPKLSTRRLLSALDGIDIQVQASSFQPVTGFLWYRQRSEIYELFKNTCAQTFGQTLVIVTPTQDDAQEIFNFIESQNLTVFFIHGQLAPTSYALWYRRILNQEPIVIIGGISTLALPYHKSPTIIIDQEEHPAHKQTAQFPHYDPRVVLRQLDIPIIVTTPAPSIEYWQRKHPPIPMANDHRQLISLHGSKPRSMLSEEVLTVIDLAIEQAQRIACIAPRTGFASATICRSCGQEISCPTCGRRAALFRGLADEARCRSCRSSLPLSTVCTRCGSSEWIFQGLGVEQTVSHLQQLRPQLTIAPVINPMVKADVVVDTYYAYRALRQLKPLGAVVIISGDSLLNVPDYSVNERAWHFLARLQAEIGSATITVQTFQPESDFWQRWLHNDDSTWYQNETQQRLRLNVPPISIEWIATWRGDISIANRLADKINVSFSKDVQVRHLPQKQNRPTEHRLLIGFASEHLATTFPWMSLFPLPWHLDKYPNSWLD